MNNKMCQGRPKALKAKQPIRCQSKHENVNYIAEKLSSSDPILDPSFNQLCQ